MTMAPEEREALGTPPLPVATWEYGEDGAETDGGPAGPGAPPPAGPPETALEGRPGHPHRGPAAGGGGHNVLP